MTKNFEAGVAQAPEKPIEEQKTPEQLELERARDIQHQQRRARGPQDWGNFAEANQGKKPEDILKDQLYGPILEEASDFSKTKQS